MFGQRCNPTLVPVPVEAIISLCAISASCSIALLVILDDEGSNVSIYHWKIPYLIELASCWKLRHTQYSISHRMMVIGSDRQIVLY
jgi:hypothetical protein